MCFKAYEPTIVQDQDGNMIIKEHPMVELAGHARAGNKDKVAEYLLENPDFNINSGFMYGDSLLTLAVKNKQYEEACWLISKGADANEEFGAPMSSIYRSSANDIAHGMDNDHMVDVLNMCSSGEFIEGVY